MAELPTQSRIAINRCPLQQDEQSGIEVVDTSILECFQDGQLLWTAEFAEGCLENSVYTAEGTAAWGSNETWSSTQPTYGLLARIDDRGTVLWTRQFDHGFQHESIAAVLSNDDGTWAVISRGDLKYLCLSRYDMDGKELSFKKTEVGNLGVWNAARLGDGYIVQLGNMQSRDTARLIKLDKAGNVLESFTYEGEDSAYYLTDMVEFGGRVYLSAYAVPKQNGGGGENEIAAVLDYVFSKEDGADDISGADLTPIVRDNYTAVLLLCNPSDGTAEAFYSVEGSLGGKLSVTDAGELAWNVESITTTFFSPATDSFTIGGNSKVFRYYFDTAGVVVRQVDTGEEIPYRR